MTEINSPQNAHFRRWKSLLDSHGIKKEGLALISGRKIVPEALRDSRDLVVALLGTKKSELSGLSERAFVLHKPLFDQLDIFGTKAPLAVIKIPKIADWSTSASPSPEFELLVGLSDPSNLGAVIRSAAAFGVKKIVLLKECAHPFLPKVFKASAGANLHMSFEKGPSIKALTVSDGFALDLEGTELKDVQWPKAGRLLVGEEGQGLPLELDLKRISIPMAANIESLNAVVATSIALYDRQTKTT